MGTACTYMVARCARGTLRSSAALCAIQHRVPLMQGQQELIDTGAPMMAQSVIPEHYAPIRGAHLSSFQAILVNPCNPSPFDCSTGNPTQSKSIHHYYILLHIIKIIFIFSAFTCTGWPDLIDRGHFKFAGRNLVGSPILMHELTPIDQQ